MEIDRRALVTGALALSAAAIVGLPAHASELNLGSSNSIKLGSTKLFTSGSNRILVHRVTTTRFTAFRASCPADSTSLSLANVKGSRVTCPKDKAAFSLLTGKSTAAPARTLEPVKIRVSKGFLLATIADSATPSPTAVAKALIATSKVPVGSGVQVSSENGPLLVIQPTTGVFRAFSAICTHAGCEVTEISTSQMVCTCHNSVFSTADGAVTSGPARRGLSQYALVERDGQLFLQ